MKKKEVKEVYAFKEDNFPSLGGCQMNIVTPISFSAALNKEQQEKKKEKNKWAGWLEMNIDGTQKQHEDSGRFERVKTMLDEMNENARHINFLEREKKEEERKREAEYYMNGPEYIHSWEVANYIANYKKKSREDTEEMSDYSDNEDFSD